MAVDAAAVDAAAGAAVAKPRILLVAPRDSYRTAPYIAAAREQGIDLLIASEGTHTLSGLEVPGVQVNLQDVPGSLQTLLSAVRAQPFQGVIGTDDVSSELAVHASMVLQLPHNSLLSVRLARRKDLAREPLGVCRVSRCPATGKLT